MYHWARYAQTMRCVWTCWCTERPQSHKQSLDFQHQPDGHKCIHLIVKGFSQVEAIDFDQVLRLSTPNISPMDLVVFLLSFLSYPIKLMTAMLSSYVSLFVSPPCLMHSSLYSSPCSAWLCSSFFSSILPPPCGCIMLYFVSIPWPCSMHASTSCY